MAEIKPSEKFLKGTFILTIASFVVKVIGALNWIFVSRILGGEGIGLYNMAFPIYFFAMTVSQAGVPVAISIITAERVALNDIYGAKRVFRISMLLMLLTGIFFSVLTYFSAQWLIEWQFIRDPRAYMSVVALSPTIFFVTFLASSRGYLQGWQRMTPTAVSQIVEQIFRVITMIVLADLLLPWGLDYAAAGASLGALAGAVTGLMVGITAGFAVMLPTSQRTEAAIAVIDARNIEEAVKTAIQTAKILTEEQKQLALQILNMKRLDASVIEELIRQNTKKDEEILAGDMVLPPGIINDKFKTVQAQWEERIGNIEDVINGNMTVYDMVIQEQKRQKAIHEASKSAAQVAQQTIQLDRQNLEDAQKALQASNESEGQHQAIQAGNYLLYDILQSVTAGNRAKAHMAASMAAYFDLKVQEQAESERILTNSKNISKRWVENSK